MKRLKKFNRNVSLSSDVNDCIYYLIAWIKGLVRRPHMYDSLITNWHLLPFYNENSMDWALLAWTDKHKRPVLYTTSNKQFLPYECVIDSTIVINTIFYNSYNPDIRPQPTNKKLLKIMQLAYNLHANNKLIRETDIEFLYTLISFEEPYFVGFQPKRYFKEKSTNDLTPSLFDEIVDHISKGDFSIINQTDDFKYNPDNYNKSY